MKFFVCCFFYTASVLAFNEYKISKFQNQLGDCEPFTVEFIAGLVTKKARQILDPGSRPRQRQLRYDLFTRLNPYKREVLLTGDRNRLLASNFNASWPVRFSIHGWNGQTTTCSNAAIKDAYLAKGDYNVILVDWTDYSLDINYIRVVAEIFEIARKFNEFTRFLQSHTAIPFSEMYLIAHSAGCHIAGVAGKLLQPDKYGVIYALDTSGPIHRRLDDKWRLAPMDALYVESVQSDVALFGFPTDNLAHASFYPNWGLGQPHCPNVTTMEPDFTCDHFGALYYFVESLRNPRAFGAIQCKNYQSIESYKCDCDAAQCTASAYMGGDPAVPKKGIFYFSTRKTMPFGYGEICRMKRPIKPTIVRIQ
ncbi:PREDICTED: phospholipase A1 2-like [Rhagoletis zephyria]|uniref:phospholipase A1 2-like n=1 Tax=Rhagoletis zephyria TaxID=28612 RepID=UPI0008119125|nr:PREDICTED: phospholipase A1 2-like [Rhagoletis zephyria]